MQMKKEWKITIKVLQMSGKLMALGCWFPPKFPNSGPLLSTAVTRKAADHIFVLMVNNSWPGAVLRVSHLGIQRRAGRHQVLESLVLGSRGGQHQRRLQVAVHRVQTSPGRHQQVSRRHVAVLDAHVQRGLLAAVPVLLVRRPALGCRTGQDRGLSRY